MDIECKTRKFELIKNFKDAFNQEMLDSKYIEECFDKYDYIVGDISSGILRLKGFTSSDMGLNSFKAIPDYLLEACVYNCGYYILKRKRKWH